MSKFAHLKPTAMSSPFLSAFSEQEQLSGGNSTDKGELKIVKYREEEAIYVQATADRVTVIFGTVFKEETDRIYGRLFLQVRPSETMSTWESQAWVTDGFLGRPAARGIGAETPRLSRTTAGVSAGEGQVRIAGLDGTGDAGTQTLQEL